MVSSLLWHNIEPNICKMYASGTKLWEFFCITKTVVPCPAQLPNFIKWVAQKTYGNSSPYMGKITSKTIHLYFIIICSTHIDCVLSVAVFKNVLLCCMLNGATSFNPSPKETTLKLPILHSIFVKIVTNSNTILKINTDAAFCFAFTKCLYMDEIFYTDK